MTKPAAFRATYSDLKLIKTRQCVQIVFELPLADFDAAYDVLGGMPNNANERWFGIAAIKDQPQPEAKRTWIDLSPAQQAGIRCNDISFQTFLKEEKPDDWHESAWSAAECVRLICGVTSRADFSVNAAAEQRWRALDTQFQAWKALEHA